ncbi:two-component regulator propeller domain-containing protein [Phocaeicola sp.]
MKKRHLLFLIVAFLLVLNVQAESITGKWSERYNFTAITMEEGLPHNFVDDIIKDSRGFLWIATRGEGLARYDGYEFTSFNMGTARAKLRSNFISGLCEDSFGRIWAISELGTDILDIHSMQKAQVPSAEGKLISFCNLPASYIFRSRAGNIWISSENNLFKLTFGKQGEVKQIIKICQLPEGESVRAICEVDEYLWMNYKDGVYRIKETTADQQEPALISSALQLPDVYIQVIRRKENEIWIGSTQGLFRYNLDTEWIKHYMHEAANDNSLSQNFITDIAETGERTMLVSTLKGINLYNALTDSFERINRDSNRNGEGLWGQNTLNCDFVNCLLADGDVIWVGTEIGGLNKMSRRMLFVQNYYHTCTLPGSLSKNPVNAIYEDATGALWVGTVEGGLNRRAPGSNTFTHYTTDAPARLSHNSVSCFTTDDEQRLWMGIWGGGIGWVDMKNPENKTFHHIDIPEYYDLSWGLAGSICYDSLNRVIWVGTSNNIYVYDPKNNQVTEPFKGMNMGGIEGCTGYYIDKENFLWLGLTRGLCRIDLSSLKAPKLVYQLWRYKLDEPESKLAERVTYITQSRDGTIWVGSNGYGCYKSSFDKNGEYVFHSFTTDDGLVSNSVRALQEDNEGHIWISTTNGLSCYDPANNSFFNYTRKDGLLSNLFYWNAIHCSANGDIYLGSIDGLSVVKPVVDIRKKEEVPMTFTHIRVADEERQPEANAICLHERDKSLYIEFAALDYDAPAFAAYFYRLKGFDDKWVKAPANRRLAAYTNLRPGNYTFELRYAPDGKQWLEQTAELHISVTPYFYKTVWFILSMLVIISFIIYKVLAWRLHSLQEQQKILHIKVEERTRELEEQKTVLATQADELYNQNELLKQQNEKITRQKEQIIEMSRKVQELTIDKLAFFTNITHEFRTPLTLIVGPIERALKLSYNPQVIEQLHFVERNSKYLLSLVNQLMDFRKIESGKMEIARNPGNIGKFLNDLLVPFEAYAADRNISIERRFRLPAKEIMYDEDAMRKVMINLLGNALKFTPQGGRITLYASTLRHKGEEQLYISVKDTGTGIPEKDMDKVFARFYQAPNQVPSSMTGQSGTGIGLYLCQQIIQLHDGHICARNNRNAGCSFRIMLPLIYADAAPNDPFAEAPEASDEQATQETAVHPAGNGRLNILVVEDNKDMRDYIRSILAEYYNVTEASQGEEALAVLKEQNIDFIISDLMMPIMDGMELSRRVKANFSISHIPFLMLTAKTSNEARIESFRIGVDEYLLKPFDDTLLLARISNILENRRRYQRRFMHSMDVEALNIDEDSSDKKFLDKAMQVVKENYKNSYYEVSDFIEAMGVSRSLLNRKMNNLTGQSAGHFMRNYRLNIARELLLKNRVTHNMNISEIAYEVGFNDPKYFTRCFTKHFNITPSSLLEGDDSEEDVPKV